MSTTTQPLKYLWAAQFADGHILQQPENDQYSKHDDTADYNPSSFRDILDYPSEVTIFVLNDRVNNRYMVNLTAGEFAHSNSQGTIPPTYSLEDEPLTDRKLIYFREMHMETNNGVTSEPYVNRYCMGYEGKDANGKVIKKVIYIA